MYKYSYQNLIYSVMCEMLKAYIKPPEIIIQHKSHKGKS